jgi:trimeric autotransporter adhesin
MSNTVLRRDTVIAYSTCPDSNTVHILTTLLFTLLSPLSSLLPPLSTATDTATGYQTGKQQASAALGVTSDHTGKYIDVGKETVFELGDKADRSLDPLAGEVKGVVVSNAEQAHDKHGRLVSAGAEKAHPLTDVLADTARETTAMTHEKAKQGADHVARTDLEAASGINSGAVNPQSNSGAAYNTTGSSTGSRGIGGVGAIGGLSSGATTTSSTTTGPDPAVGAYGTTFDEINPLHASSKEASRSTGAAQSGAGFASFPNSTVYPAASESLQGDSAAGGLHSSTGNTSSGSSSKFDTFPTDVTYPQDAPLQSLTGTTGSTGSSANNTTTSAYTTGTGTGFSGDSSSSSRGTGSYGNSTTGTSGYDNTTTGTSGFSSSSGTTSTGADTNATADKAAGVVNKFKEDAVRSKQEGKPQGTVADAQGAASLLSTAARAGKEEYQRTDGSAVDTKQHGQQAASELTEAAKGLQSDLTAGGTGEGEGASRSTEQSTISAAKTAGAALKSAVTDYKTHKESSAATDDADKPKKTEVLKAKALETFDSKASEEDKRAAAIVQEEATRRAEVAKEQAAAAKARAAEIQAEAQRTAELAKHDASAASTGVKDTLLKAHNAKTDEKATKAILSSAERGAASAQQLSENLTTGLMALKQSLSGGMATTKDTVVEGIQTAEQAKRGEGDAGFVAQHAQQRYAEGSSAAQQGLEKGRGGLEQARSGAAQAGAAAQGGGATAAQGAAEGMQSGKEQGYGKAHSAVERANDPELKGQYADKAKSYADQGLDAAHQGIGSGQQQAHSTIDSVAPKVDAKGHVVIDQAAGTVQSGIDTAASQAHGLIGTGLTTVDQQGDVAKAVVDQKLSAAQQAAKEKEALAKENIKLASDVASVFFGAKPSKK